MLRRRCRQAREPRAAAHRQAERDQPDERDSARDDAGGAERSLPSPPAGDEDVLAARAVKELLLESRHPHVLR
jgi:hypothetical protein